MFTRWDGRGGWGAAAHAAPGSARTSAESLDPLRTPAWRARPSPDASRAARGARPPLPPTRRATGSGSGSEAPRPGPVLQPALPKVPLTAQPSSQDSARSAHLAPAPERRRPCPSPGSRPQRALPSPPPTPTYPHPTPSPTRTAGPWLSRDARARSLPGLCPAPEAKPRPSSLLRGLRVLFPRTLGLRRDVRGGGGGEGARGPSHLEPRPAVGARLLRGGGVSALGGPGGWHAGRAHPSPPWMGCGPLRRVPAPRAVREVSGRRQMAHLRASASPGCPRDPVGSQGPPSKEAPAAHSSPGLESSSAAVAGPLSAEEHSGAGGDRNPFHPRLRWNPDPSLGPSSPLTGW